MTYDTGQSPVLAEAAHVLSDQLHLHLLDLARFLLPHIDRLEKRFLQRLQRLGYDRRQQTALAAITLGAAGRVFAAGRPTAVFAEQIEYNGRRLAKLNLPPNDILRALQEYDQLLAPLLAGLQPKKAERYHWVREQLHFCVVLTLNNAYYQVREAETRAVNELFRVELEARDLAGLLERFLNTLRGSAQASAGQIYLWDNEIQSLVPRAHVTSTGTAPLAAAMRATAPRLKSLSKPRYFTLPSKAGDVSHLLDPSWQHLYRSCWSVPLVAPGGHTAGLMQLAFPKPYEWLPRERELLVAAAERCLMAAEKTRLMEDLARREEQLRHLAERMLHVEEMERRRISRELHDEAGQSLLCIRLQLEMAADTLGPEQQELAQQLHSVRQVAEHTILEIRRLIAALSPAVLERLGLGAALRQLITRFQKGHRCRVRLDLHRLEPLPKQTEVVVYRLVQECCNNIGKHSQATRVNISATSADGWLRLQVSDNGVGFAVEEALAKQGSYGLAGLRERIALLGGRFAIESKPASEGTKSRSQRRGTSLVMELPIPADPVP